MPNRVGVVHGVELSYDTICNVRLVSNRIISRTGGSREEANVVLFIRSCVEKITTHSPSSIEERVIVEETGELC